MWTTSSAPLLFALFFAAEGQVAEGATQPQSDRELGPNDAVLEERERPGCESVEDQTEVPFQFRAAWQGTEFSSEGAVFRTDSLSAR